MAAAFAAYAEETQEITAAPRFEAGGWFQFLCGSGYHG